MQIGDIEPPGDLDGCVELGLGESVPGDEPREQLLEILAGDPHPKAGARQRRAQRRGPPLAAVALEQGGERQWIGQPSHLGLVDGAKQGIGIQDRGQIQEGPGYRRDRDAVEHGALVGRQRGGVDLDPVVCRPPGRHGDRCPAAPATKRPFGTGRPVAEDGAGAAAEHGGHPPALDRQRPVADGVDTPVEAMNTTAGEAR
jgi:hypothetical protein